jgi:MFS family permease
MPAIEPVETTDLAMIPITGRSDFGHISKAASSSAYLTASEIFPLETRALAIAVFYAGGTAIGGIAAPWLFGTLIGTGSRWSVFFGYCGAALLMMGAAVMEIRFGVDAEGRSLEQIADPLSV